MGYTSLILMGLRRRLLRTLLTGASIFVAFLLLGVTNGITQGFDEAQDFMSDSRLRTISRANMIEPLPYAHGARIEQVEGITHVSPLAIFPAYYQEMFNQVSAAALHLDNAFEVLNEIALSEEEKEKLLATRTGATVGAKLAERFGWKVGDQIPLTSYFLVQEDGSNTWTFEIVSIHNDDPGDEELLAGEVYFHYDYLNESRAAQKDTVNMFITSIDDPEAASDIGQRIDALFANSSDETQTMDEKQFLTNQLRSIGDIRTFVLAIQFAVLFTLLFIAGSTMWQSVRERVGEFAILKALGFTDNFVFGVIILESIVMCLIAGMLGLGMAALVFPSVFASMGLPGIGMSGGVWVVGTIIALIMAVVVAITPAWQMRRLPVADAVRVE